MINSIFFPVCTFAKNMTLDKYFLFKNNLDNVLTHDFINPKYSFLPVINAKT